MFDETFWVAVAFVLFVGVIVYLKVPGMITRALDERADKIRRELEEAQRLREEAQALFADYQRKQKNALKEAEEIISHANLEAKRLAVQAEADLKAALERRRALAELKIAQAEAQALKDVRDAAAEIAVAAAGQVIAGQLKGPAADALVERAIADVKAKLH